MKGLPASGWSMYRTSMRYSPGNETLSEAASELRLVQIVSRFLSVMENCQIARLGCSGSYTELTNNSGSEFNRHLPSGGDISQCERYHAAFGVSYSGVQLLRRYTASQILEMYVNRSRIYHDNN